MCSGGSPSTADALAEQHRPQLDLDRVERAGFERLPGGVRVVHHDVAVAGAALAWCTQAAMPLVT